MRCNPLIKQCLVHSRLTDMKLVTNIFKIILEWQLLNTNLVPFCQRHGFDTLVQKDQNQGLEREPIQNLEQELEFVQMTTDADYISPGKNADIFTEEEELQFSRRHDEGYDLYDEHYLAWLSLNYPEEVESYSVAQFFNDVFPIILELI